MGQAELARAIGRLPQDVYKWEHGRPVPSDIVPDIARELHVTICVLYGVSEEHPVSDVESRIKGSVGKTKAKLSDAERDFLAEVADAFERYRARLQREEGL
jgi:DNA-binding XRE family transcriptional regulator